MAQTLVPARPRLATRPAFAWMLWASSYQSTGCLALAVQSLPSACCFTVPQLAQGVAAAVSRPRTLPACAEMVFWKSAQCTCWPVL